MGRKSVLCSSIGIFLILIMMTFVTTLSVSASPLTSVTLDLQDEVPSVDVSPGSSGVVTAQGTVTCEKWGPDQVKVSLTGNSTHGGANVNPPNMVFGGNAGAEETRTFAVTTRVPQGTSCNDKPKITVMGVYVQGGMQYAIDPVSINIEILQYYHVDIFFDDGGSRSMNHTTIKAGESVSVDFSVHNTGNGNDNFDIDFNDRDELKGSGFSLPNSKTLSIPERRNEDVSWIVETSEDMLGRHRLDLIVISKGSQESGGNVKYLSPIFIEVEERTVVDRIGAILLSPLVIILIIVIALVIIMVWLRRKE